MSGHHKGLEAASVRCLEFQVVSSIPETRWALATLPATVEHVRFHFDCRHAPHLWSAAPWLNGFADLLVRKLHPDDMCTDADLYLERYLKETSQHYQVGLERRDPIKFGQDEDSAIVRTSTQTLSFPKQLKTLTVVAATAYPEAKFDLGMDPVLTWDTVSTEKDWLHCDQVSLNDERDGLDGCPASPMITGLTRWLDSTRQAGRSEG